MPIDNEMSEEDYLKKHLSEIDAQKNLFKENGEIQNVQDTGTKDSTRTTDLQYLSFDINELPCGEFYPTGTVLMVRAAQIREIQSYSMVDDNNFYDIIEKMNDMLQACVRVKYPDGRVASYLEVKDQDRFPLIFLIRDLTFQQGNTLQTGKVRCTCGEEFSIELKRDNFVYHKIDEKLDKYFSRSTRSYFFTTINNNEFELCPPNIGLQKSFTEYIIKENEEKRNPNLAFLKIIPFTLPGRNSITYEGIKAKLKEFEQMDDISFQFLNSAVSKMTFGIKELKKKCTCGEEIHTDMQFPNGASSIFVIHDAFEAYIKE
jgi:hypothetical protein